VKVSASSMLFSHRVRMPRKRNSARPLAIVLPLPDVLYARRCRAAAKFCDVDCDVTLLASRANMRSRLLACGHAQLAQWPSSPRFSVTCAYSCSSLESSSDELSRRRSRVRVPSAPPNRSVTYGHGVPSAARFVTCFVTVLPLCNCPEKHTMIEAGAARHPGAVARGT
jgi:hypothetical protein